MIHPKKLLQGLIGLLLLASAPIGAQAAFVHPGVTHTLTDLNRMKNNVTVEPYKTAYDAFRSQGYAQYTNTGQGPFATVATGNHEFAMRNDATVCYYNAIMWYVTSDVRYRDNAIQLMNGWANTLTSFDPSEHITAGGAGCDFANAAEIIRSTGNGAWATADITKFQNMLLTYLYPSCLTPGNGFLEAAGHGGLQMKGLFAIGVFCDRQDIFDFAVSSYKHNAGWTYGLEEYIHSSGQNYETQRDQGHASGNIGTFSENAKIALNQGVDLYPYANNLLAKAFESQAKINLLYDVQPVSWTAADGSGHSGISPDSRQPYDNLPSDLGFNIYANIKGLKMPYTQMSADLKFPDSGRSFLFRVDNSGKVPTKPLYGEPAPKDVVLFGDGGFSGAYLAHFGPGNYNAAALLTGGVTGGPWGNGAYTASSIKVPAGWTVTLYDSDNFTGTSVVLTANQPDLGSIGWNDRQVSMKVQSGGTYKVSNGTYRIVSNSGKVADVSGASQAENGNIIQWPYSSSSNQLWRVEDVGGGQYRIININSGKAMQVAGASLADGTSNPADPGNVNQGTYIVAVNQATGGTATASAGGAGEGAAQAFDANNNTKWFNGVNGGTGFLQYQFTSAKVLDQYQITSANDVPERDPAAWQFQGSNNGTTWTTLDTRSGETFSNRFTTNTYTFSNITSYTYYRLNITANRGGSGYGLQLAELPLYSLQSTGKHQRWTITGVTGSSFGSTMTVTNVNSSKVLNVYGASSSDGANIVQSTPDTSSGGISQKWLFQTP